MPFAQGPFSRIININWGDNGGAIVVTGSDGYVAKMFDDSGAVVAQCATIGGMTFQRTVDIVVYDRIFTDTVIFEDSVEIPPYTFNNGGGAACLDKDQNILVTMAALNSSSTPPPSPITNTATGRQVILAKYSSGGALLGTYGSPEPSYDRIGVGVACDDDNNVFITETTGAPGAAKLTKLSAALSVIWSASGLGDSPGSCAVSGSWVGAIVDGALYFYDVALVKPRLTSELSNVADVSSRGDGFLVINDEVVSKVRIVEHVDDIEIVEDWSNALSDGYACDIGADGSCYAVSVPESGAAPTVHKYTSEGALVYSFSIPDWLEGDDSIGDFTASDQVWVITTTRVFDNNDFGAPRTGYAKAFNAETTAQAWEYEWGTWTNLHLVEYTYPEMTAVLGGTDNRSGTTIVIGNTYDPPHELVASVGR